MILDKLDEVIRLHYSLCQWDKAIEMKNRALTIIEDLCEENKMKQSDIDIVDRRLAKLAYKLEMMDQEYELLNKSINEIESNDWKLYTTQKKVKLFYKNNSDDKFITLKSEAVLDTNIMNLMALVYQPELAHKWMPLLKKMKGVGYIDKRFGT